MFEELPEAVGAELGLRPPLSELFYALLERQFSVSHEAAGARQEV